MTELLPPYDPVDILCMAALINPFYVNCLPLNLSFASTPYSCCPTILKISLNVNFYLGKYRLLGKKEEKSLALICVSPWGPLDNVPDPSGTRSCLGSTNSLRPQLPLPATWAKPESPNLLTALLYVPTQALLCHLPTCQPVLPPSLSYLHFSRAPLPQGHSWSPAPSLSFPAHWAEFHSDSG